MRLSLSILIYKGEGCQKQKEKLWIFLYHEMIKEKAQNQLHVSAAPSAALSSIISQSNCTHKLGRPEISASKLSCGSGIVWGHTPSGED